MRLLNTLAIATAVFLGSGCATILKGGGRTSSVLFHNAPEDLEVLVNGEPAEFSSLWVCGDAEYDYYGPGVWLRTAKGPYTLTLLSGGRQVEVPLTTRVPAGWVVLDIFVGLGVGVVVDAATGSWKEFRLQTIDVTEAFDNPDATVADATAAAATHCRNR